MKNTDTTITDKNNFQVTIIDKEKFSKLPENIKEQFLLIRNSVLEIFPLSDNKYDELCLKLAENFAFINLKALEKMQTIYDEKFAELSKQLNSLSTTTINTTVKS